MSIPLSDTPSSILFHRLTLQTNTNTSVSNMNDSNDHKHTTNKSLPPFPQQQREVLSTKVPNSKRVYQSTSASTSSSSVHNRKVLNGSPNINSRSSSKSSISSHSTIDSPSTVNTKVNNEVHYSTPVSPNFYDNDNNDGNTVSSINKINSVNGSTEKNYDLSYYFYQEENDNHYDIPPSSKTTGENRYAGDIAPSKEDIQASSNTLYRARSLSIGSTISSHFISSISSTTVAFEDSSVGGDTNEKDDNNDDDTTIVATPHCKVQQFFKRKMEKSNKKSYPIFSEQTKLEISVKEIKREGLKALLYSTVPLGYFLYHLLNEYSSENLFFYLAVENYQRYNFSSELERQQVAHKISKSYLTRNSELEVNLEDQISRKVKRALLEQQNRPSESTGNEFDLAKRHVFSLLNVKYYQFRTSSVWNIMESKCSDLNSSNLERSQALVVNLLLSYIKRNSSPSLFKLVHSFCKIYLPIGYESRLSSSNTIVKEKSCSKNNRSRSKSVGGSDKKSNSNYISNKIDTIFFKTNKINR